MSSLGVGTEIAELAIGHQRNGLERVYNFDEAWQLRCEAFAKVSDHRCAPPHRQRGRQDRCHAGADLNPPFSAMTVCSLAVAATADSREACLSLSSPQPQRLRIEPAPGGGAKNA
jgi:hypothetical protein